MRVGHHVYSSMDPLTLAKLAGWIIAGAVFIYHTWKYNQVKNLKSTNEILHSENDGLKNLLEVKEQLLAADRQELEKIKTSIEVNRSVAEVMIGELKRELDLIRNTNDLLQNQILAGKEAIRAYRDILIEVKDTCSDPECQRCKKIRRILEIQ